MLTCNSNTKDRIVNRVVGKFIRKGHGRNTIKAIYVKFDNQNAGLTTIQSNVIPRQQHLVAIQKRRKNLLLKEANFL